MKLRYYLRGLGIGIFVTALVMSIAFRGKGDNLSDEQIRKRALAMGMVDGSQTLKPRPDSAGTSEPTGSGKEPENPVGTSEPTGSGKEPENPAGTSEPTGSVSPTKESGTAANPTKEPNASTEPTDESSDASQPTITIVIERGSGSDRVSRSLEEAGLVEDAKTYDQYLCDNGYSKGLRAGTYEIPVGASHEEIAGIIAQKR